MSLPRGCVTESGKGARIVKQTEVGLWTEVCHYCRRVIYYAGS